MQKTLLSAALVAAVAAIGFAPSAQAATIGSGTISITGRVVGNTCTVTANGGAAVVLPNVMTDDLNAAGTTAGAKSFDIAVSGCDSAITTTQMVFGGTGRNANGNLDNTAAGGSTAQVQLLSGGAVINTQDQTNAPAISLTSGAGSTTLTAQYYANGAAATAGAVSASVDFTLTYL